MPPLLINWQPLHRSQMKLSTNQDVQTIHITPTAAETIDSKQQRLAVLAEDTRTRMKRSALDIYHIGANLLEAQDLLAHGEFLPWIEAEFGMGKSSAYKFINVAKAFQGKFPQNGNLEIAASALYLLASPETPEDARDEVLRLASAGEPISPKKARKIVEKHASVAQETAALGESLGLPTRGDSILRQSDRLDDLTHSSPADVDDRPGALPLTPFEVMKNSARRGIQGYLSGMSSTAVAQVLSAMATQAHGWERHVDAVAHRFPHRDRVSLRPAIIKVFWEIAQGRKTLTQAVDAILPEISATHDNEEQSPSIVQAELGDEPKSDPPKSPLDRAIEKFNAKAAAERAAFVPTPAQWQAAQVKHVELLQALRDAQVEIGQLKAERDLLNTECVALKSEMADLKASNQTCAVDHVAAV